MKRFALPAAGLIALLACSQARAAGNDSVAPGSPAANPASRVETAEDEVIAPPKAATVVAPAPATPSKDPEAAKERRVTALVRAAADPDPAKLKALLRANAPVNGQNAHDETPLQSAAAEGLPSNVFALIAAGAEIDKLAGRGITALGWAARGGHLQAARTLLDAGANPDAAQSPDRSPIALAAAREEQAIVALLVDRGSKVFENPQLAGAVLAAIAQTTSVDMVNLVVPRVSAMLEHAPGLRDAAASAVAGSNAAISQAMMSGLGEASRTREFQTALLFAAIRRGRADVATAAITAGADVNAKHPQMKSPLAIAVSLGDASMVTLLMSAEADWKAEGIDQARLAELAGSEVSDRAEAEKLASAGQIDRLDARGETLLFRAAQRGNFLAVKRLLAAGANPATTVRRWPGDEGWTPLMTASAGNQIAVVRLLLSSGAPVDQRNAAGRTALSYAAFYGRSAVIDALVAAGADPRVADDVGQTPMALANASGDAAAILRMQLSLKATAGVVRSDAATAEQTK